MDIWSLLRRVANVVGVLMALGALVLIALFMMNLWAAYGG